MDTTCAHQNIAVSSKAVLVVVKVMEMLLSNGTETIPSFAYSQRNVLHIYRVLAAFLAGMILCEAHNYSYHHRTMVYYSSPTIDELNSTLPSLVDGSQLREPRQRASPSLATSTYLNKK